MKTLLLLGDLSPSTFRLQLYLDDLGYRTLIYTRAEAMLEWQGSSPDGLLIDVQDHLDLGRHMEALRKRFAIPILLFASRMERTLAVQLLDLGADDCLYRPIDPAEVKAHLQAVMRRYPPSTVLFAAAKTI